MLKITSAVMMVLVIGFTLYVARVNTNSNDMTLRQKILKAVYPAMMWISNKTGKNILTLSNTSTDPVESIYSLTATLNDGQVFSLSECKGKKIMLVNTASDCGYTRQYEELEKLYKEHKHKLVILAFPSNDFKDQEQYNDKTIAAFCKLNFGVTFPLAQKSAVIKKPGQNEIFRWLTDKNRNGWNNQQPGWNFCKYLVDENGRLTHFFSSSIEPASMEVVEAVRK